MKSFLGAVLLFSSMSLSLAGQARPARRAPQKPKPPAPRVETYESAVIDADGNIRIITADHRDIVVKKDGEQDGVREQTAFRAPTLSSSRTAVGAQADYAGCCTSYDIPLELVVYAQGRLHRFRGVGLPIFTWHFADAGTRIAYSQETVHFSCSTHYELRDIQSERLIDSVDVPELCAEDQHPQAVKIPNWVKELEKAPRR
jgi:hypothetical protein